MYEDEYFISLLKKKEAAPESMSVDDIIFYKYFSDLSEQEFNDYEMDTVNHTYTKERANVLGVSVPHVNSWVTTSNG